MRNPFRPRYAVVGDNGRDVEVIRKFHDKVAAEQRAELLNLFAQAVGMRTRARVVKIED